MAGQKLAVIENKFHVMLVSNKLLFGESPGGAERIKI